MVKTLKVYSTKDYSVFKKLENNRDVGSVRKLINSINKVGYIPCPIIVNEKMEVIDGQNRIEALKSLDLPIQYYIVEGIGINEARQMNLNRANWKPMDYVKSYAKEGNPNYIRLMEIMDIAKFIGLSEAFGICKGRIISTGMAQSLVGSGNLEITADEYAKAKVLVKQICNIEEQIKGLKGHRRTIVTGLAWCYGVKGVDKRRLTLLIKNKYPLIRPVVDVDMFLTDISDLYNRKLDKSKRIYFNTEWKKEN